MSSFGHLFYKFRIKVHVINPGITDVLSMIEYLVNVIIHYTFLSVNAHNFFSLKHFAHRSILI